MGMGRLRDFTATSLVGELQFLPAIRLWRGLLLVLISMPFSKANAEACKRQRLLRTVQA